MQQRNPPRPIPTVMSTGENQGSNPGLGNLFMGPPIVTSPPLITLAVPQPIVPQGVGDSIDQVSMHASLGSPGALAVIDTAFDTMGGDQTATSYVEEYANMGRGGSMLRVPRLVPDYDNNQSSFTFRDQSTIPSLEILNKTVHNPSMPTVTFQGPSSPQLPLSNARDLNVSKPSIQWDYYMPRSQSLDPTWIRETNTDPRHLSTTLLEARYRCCVSDPLNPDSHQNLAHASTLIRDREIGCYDRLPSGQNQDTHSHLCPTQELDRRYRHRSPIADFDRLSRSKHPTLFYSHHGRIQSPSPDRGRRSFRSPHLDSRYAYRLSPVGNQYQCPSPTRNQSNLPPQIRPSRPVTRHRPIVEDCPVQYSNSVQYGSPPRPLDLSLSRIPPNHPNQSLSPHIRFNNPVYQSQYPAQYPVVNECPIPHTDQYSRQSQAGSHLRNPPSGQQYNACYTNTRAGIGDNVYDRASAYYMEAPMGVESTIPGQCASVPAKGVLAPAIIIPAPAVSLPAPVVQSHAPSVIDCTPFVESLAPVVSALAPAVDALASCSSVPPPTIEVVGADNMRTMLDSFAKILGKNQSTTPSKLSRFSGDRQGESLESWMEDFDRYASESRISPSEQVSVLLRHLTGAAKDELRCYDGETRESIIAVRRILKAKFSKAGSLADLNSAFGTRNRHENESSDEYSRELIKAYQKMIDTALTEQNRSSLRDLQDSSLKGRFRKGMRSPIMNVELRRLEQDPSITFNEMRDQVALLFSHDDDDLEPVKKTSRVRAAQVIDAAPPSSMGMSSEAMMRMIQDQQLQLSNLTKEQQLVNAQLREQTASMQSLAQGGQSTYRNPGGHSHHFEQGPQSFNQGGPSSYRNPGGSAPYSQHTDNHPKIPKHVFRAAIATDICTFCSKAGHFRVKCPQIKNLSKVKATSPQPSENATALKL